MERKRMKGLGAVLASLAVAGGIIAGGKATWRHIQSKAACSPVFDLEAFKESFNDPENVRRFREGKENSASLYEVIGPYIESETGEKYDKSTFLTDLHKFEVGKERELNQQYTDKDLIADIDKDKDRILREFLEYSIKD